VSKYYVREEVAGIAREVGYDTLAEVQAVLKELDSREYKPVDKPKRLLTAGMIREASSRFFSNYPSDHFLFNRTSMMDTDPQRSIGFNLFLSDLADMLNAELSK
jgi:hypothetical protein